MVALSEVPAAGFTAVSPTTITANVPLADHSLSSAASNVFASECRQCQAQGTRRGPLLILSKRARSGQQASRTQKGSSKMASGEEILQLAKRHVGEKYTLGVVVPKDKANATGPWDCAEFASWCVYQASGKLFGCNRDTGDPSTADAYTGFWADDAKQRGYVIPIEEAIRTPGAALVRRPSGGSKIGHIVISDGHGGTVEAHSRKRGVIAGSAHGRVWDLGVLVPFIVYAAGAGAGDTAPPLGVIYRVQMPMMSGARVRDIQQALAAKGFDPGPVDGFYGPMTAAAVTAFQLDQGDLVADGEVGPLTAQALGVPFP